MLQIRGQMMIIIIHFDMDPHTHYFPFFASFFYLCYLSKKPESSGDAYILKGRYKLPENLQVKYISEKKQMF